ncbi:hypothetical protein DFH28DRAFT_1223385 [Melampsora americana]|nr:hypothetical protein DFH28DRAFT_1223385 [Melampsora americana]
MADHNDLIQNQRISNRIVNLYNQYIEAGGSARISMWQLREDFSKIIPYEDPWFHAHFSVLARDAIENDRANGRPVYNIGGDPPPAHIHIRDTLPWIVPPPQEEQQQPQIPLQFNQVNHFERFEGQQQLDHRQQEGFLHQQIQFPPHQDMFERFDQNPDIGFRGRQAGPEVRRENQERGIRRRKKRSRRDGERGREEDEERGTDAGYSESETDEKPPLPFEKRKQRNTTPISKDRQTINQAIDAYREAGISYSARAFERLADKPIHFPNSLIKDLLQFKFIDMEKMLQEISADDTDRNKILEFDPNSKKLESKAKQIKRRFKSVGEWRKVTEAYNTALQMAFPGAEESFEKYFEHLKQSEYTYETWGDWSRVSWLPSKAKTPTSKINKERVLLNTATTTKSPTNKTQTPEHTARTDFPGHHGQGRSNRNQRRSKTKSAGTGTSTDAPLLIVPEFITAVISLDVLEHIEELITTPQEVAAKRKYKRGLEWDWTTPEGFSAAIESSLTAEPFPDPPPLTSDPAAAYAIARRPELFKIISDKRLERRFLANGRTPRRLGPRSKEPLSMRRPHRPTRKSKRRRNARRKILASVRHAARRHEGVTTTARIKSRHQQKEIEKAHKSKDLIMWKSDVKNAYRLLPMAPQWQLRQVVRIANQFHIDRCANFGSSASAKLWCGFFSLVLWIAENVFGIRHLNNLMDDTWGIASQDEMVTFKEKSIPKDQALLLLLFDKIKVPWDWKKQLHGRELEVIGFWVEPNKLKFSLSPEKKSDLISKLSDFTRSNQHNLRDWQRMLGWCSWAINVFPLGRVALQSSWDKIAGKTHKRLVVPHNKEIQTDLRWLATKLEQSDGINLLEASLWPLAEADVAYTADACTSGIGIWDPAKKLGYHLSLPLPAREIYWAELLAAGHAINFAITNNKKKIVVCSDSRNTCDLFLSHRAVPADHPPPREGKRDRRRTIKRVHRARQASRREVQLALARTDADASLAASTKAKYRSALTAYLDFCASENLPTQPTIETISRFIAVSVRRPSPRTGRPLAPRSIACYLSGIASALHPQWPQVKSITDHPNVRKTLKGAMKSFSLPVSRKDPITLEDIEVVASGSGTSIDERLFLTILSIGFHGLHRLGELTIPDSSRASLYLSPTQTAPTKGPASQARTSTKLTSFSPKPNLTPFTPQTTLTIPPPAPIHATQIFSPFPPPYHSNNHSGSPAAHHLERAATHQDMVPDQVPRVLWTQQIGTLPALGRSNSPRTSRVANGFHTNIRQMVIRSVPHLRPRPPTPSAGSEERTPPSRSKPRRCFRYLLRGKARRESYPDPGSVSNLIKIPAAALLRDGVPPNPHVHVPAPPIPLCQGKRAIFLITPSCPYLTFLPPGEFHEADPKLQLFSHSHDGVSPPQDEGRAL